MTSRLIDMPVQNRSASIVAESVNSEERTVELIWSTGAAVRRYDFWTGETYDETLSLEEGQVDLSRLNDGAPFLNSHNSYELDSILGVVSRAWVENGVGKALVKMDSGEAAQEVLRKIKDGILRNVSIGYSVTKYEKTGEDGKVPEYRAVSWQPYEISAVCVGADAGAGFRSKAVSNHCVIFEKREEPMTKENENPEVAEEEIPEAVVTATATEEVAVAKAVQEERKRCADIMTTAGKLGVPESFARDLIKQGVSFFRAQTAMIDHAAENSPTTGIRSQQQGDGKGKKAIDPDMPLEERAKAEWDGSADLRAEFRGNYGAYLSFQRNFEKGNIRLKSDRN